MHTPLNHISDSWSELRLLRSNLEMISLLFSLFCLQSKVPHVRKVPTREEEVGTHLKEF